MSCFEHEQEKKHKDISRGGGGHLTRAPDSQCVINIVPPRHVWGDMQRLRTKYIPEARCAVHISFIDPFVLSSQYDEANALLSATLNDFAPIELKLSKLDFFSHGKNSFTLYVAPEDTKPLTLLRQRVLSVFPQCEDKKRPFVPHFSLAKFTSRVELEKAMTTLSTSWKPVSFVLKELYFLSRIGSTPFQVHSVVPLGGVATTSITKPHFGPGSEDDKVDNQVGRSVVVFGNMASASSSSSSSRAAERKLNIKPPDDTFSTSRAVDCIRALGVAIVTTEVNRNPNGNERPIIVIEFSTIADAATALNIKLPSNWYICPLAMLTFPDVCGGTCLLGSL